MREFAFARVRSGVFFHDLARVFLNMKKKREFDEVSQCDAVERRKRALPKHAHVDIEFFVYSAPSARSPRVEYRKRRAAIRGIFKGFGKIVGPSQARRGVQYRRREPGMIQELDVSRRFRRTSKPSSSAASLEDRICDRPG